MALQKEVMTINGNVSASYWKLTQVNRFRGNPREGMFCVQLFINKAHADTFGAEPLDSISIPYSSSENPFTAEARAVYDDDAIAYQFIKIKIGSEQNPGLAFKLYGATDLL